jgi:NAD(P)H-hydrate epimerase
MYLVTANEMQRMDRATIASFGIPGRVLMESAGRGATVFFLEELYRRHAGSVGVAAGRGNNGGDGFVMARYLHQKAIPVTVFLLAEKGRIAGDAGANLALLTQMGVRVVEVADAAALKAQQSIMRHQQLWIDAILGTGLSADVRGHYRETIDFINRQQRPVFAVDIASGLNADTGQVCGTCIQAAATATFGFAKIGHVTYPGRSCSGRVKVIEIGIPPAIAADVGCKQHLITPHALKKIMPLRSPEAHKGQSGHVLILAGAPGKTGAAAMTARAAMRTGAGLVTLGIPIGLHRVVEPMLTETMTVGLPQTDAGTLDASAAEPVRALMDGKRCLAVGPGVGTDPATGVLVRQVIETSSVPVVVDADAVNLIARDTATLARRKAPIVLTPHPGEMSRLCGRPTAEIQRDRIGHARAFAQRHQVHLVLKGAATVVAHPEGTVFVNATGNPGMAAGGMGDVLTGLIAGLIAQGLDTAAAARTAVYLHGLAADRLSATKGPVGYLATEVIDAIPEALNVLLTGGQGSPGPQLDPLCYQ